MPATWILRAGGSHGRLSIKEVDLGLYVLFLSHPDKMNRKQTRVYLKTYVRKLIYIYIYIYISSQEVRGDNLLEKVPRPFFLIEV